MLHFACAVTGGAAHSIFQARAVADGATGRLRFGGDGHTRTKPIIRPIAGLCRGSCTIRGGEKDSELPELPRLKSYSRLEKIIQITNSGDSGNPSGSDGPRRSGRLTATLQLSFLAFSLHVWGGFCLPCQQHDTIQPPKARSKIQNWLTEKGVWPWVNRSFRTGSAFWRINGTPKTREPHPTHLMGIRKAVFIDFFWVRGFLRAPSFARRLRLMRKRPAGACPTVRRSRRRDPLPMTADHRRRVR